MDSKVLDQWRITKYDENLSTEENDLIATEFPLTIVLNGIEFATIVCSPMHIRELTLGFLASEGIILFAENIKQLDIDEGKGFVYVEVDRKIEEDIQQSSKRYIGSCCGKSRQFYFQSDVKTAKTIMSRTKMSVQQCHALMETMHEESKYFQETGAIHNAALATPNKIIEIRSDIGRHNALDKLYGYVLDNRISVQDKVIIFSGRMSSEVILKVAKIGIGIIISKSAPTDLAIKIANDLNITMVGFVRGNNLNLYTHTDRIYDNDF